MNVGIFGALGIVFVVLKLIGVIDWSWLWILAPFWIGAILWILFVGGIFLLEQIFKKDKF